MNDIQPSDFDLFKKNAAFGSGKKASTLEMKGALMPQLEPFSKELKIGQPIRVKEELLALNREPQVKSPLSQISPHKPRYYAEFLKSEASALSIKFSNYSVLSQCQAFYKKILGQFSCQYKLADFFQRIFEGANRIDEANNELFSSGITCVNFPFENTLAKILYLMKVCTPVNWNNPFFNSKQKPVCCSI